VNHYDDLDLHPVAVGVLAPLSCFFWPVLNKYTTCYAAAKMVEEKESNHTDTVQLRLWQ